MLAVNDAALALFDAPDLDRILGRGITERLAPEQATIWRDFAARVWTAGSGSCDVDLIDADGNRTALLMHGVALSDHPDGIESILIAVRDTSASRRLERMLEDSERKGRTLEETSWHQIEPLSVDSPDLTARLEETQVDRQRLADLVDQRDAERRQLEAEFAADRVRLQEALAKDQQLGMLQQQREAQAVRDDLQEQLAAALAERPRLQTTIDEHLDGRNRAQAEFAAARAHLEAALSEAEAERRRLAELLGQRDAERAQREEDHAADLARLEEGQELVARQREREAQAAHDALQAKLDAVLAELPQLQGALDQHAESRNRDDAEHAAARAQSEAALAGAHAERRHLADLLEQRDAERRQLEADHAADLARLEEGQELVARQKEREAQAVHDALQAQLAAVLAERPRLQSALDQHAESRDRVDAEYAAARAQYETALAQLAHAQTEGRRLSDLLEQRDAERRHLEAEHAADLTRLEEGHELVARQREREAQAVRDDLQAQLAAVLAERPRLQSALDQHVESRDRVDAEYAAARAQRESAVAELAGVQAERHRLAGLLEQRDAERGRLEAEHAADVTRLEERHGLAALQKEREGQAALDALRTQLAEALAEQPRLQTAIDLHRDSRDRVEAEYAAARAQFEAAQAEIVQRDAERRTREEVEAAHDADRSQREQALAADQQAAMLQRERDAQAALDDLQAGLTSALAEQVRLQETIDQHRESRERIDAEYAAARAQLETAHAEHQADRQRLTDLVAQRAAERHALEAAHAADRAQLEQGMAAEQQLVIRQRERDAQNALDDVRAQLAGALAEQPRLQAAIDEHRESRDRIDAEYAAARQQFETAHAEHQADRQRLTDLVAQRAAERHALEAAHAADRAQLEQGMAAEQQLVVRQRERDAQSALDDLRGQLAGALAEQPRLQAAIDEHRESRERIDAEYAAARQQFETAHAEDIAQRAAERHALEAAHAADRAQLQQGMAAEQQLAIKQREHDAQAALDELRGQLAAALAEQPRLQATIDEHRESRDRIDAEYTAARAQFETARAEDIAQRAAERQALEAAHATDRAQLQQEMAAGQQLTVTQLERDAQAALDDLRAQLAGALAEQPRLQATIDEHRESRDRIATEYAAARAEFETSQAEHVQRDAERRRALEDLDAARAADLARVERALAEEHEHLARRDLEHRDLLAEMHLRLDGAFAEHLHVTQVLEQQEARYRLLESEHATNLAEVQAALREQHEAALSSREHDARKLDEAQVRLVQATANHDRVRTLLAESESWQMQVVAEHTADRMRGERALAHAILERTLVLKALADLRVELQAATDNAHALETLAAAGRVNLDVGRELDAILNDLGAAAKHLLGLAPLEAPYRREVETLAAATLRAGSLARQFRYAESSESEPPETL
jgi:chromosome segregation ATPase